MGWDIRGWLFGRPKKDNTDDILKQMRNERDEIDRQLSQERNAARLRQEAYDKRTTQLGNTISSLQIAQTEQAESFQNQFAAQAQQFQAQNDNLSQLMIQQQGQFDTALAAQQAATAEQARRAAALQTSYVPGMQSVAVSPTSAQGSLDGLRKRRDNELSELSIVSNNASTPMAKSGLQIA